MEKDELLPCPFCDWPLQWPPSVIDGAVECPDCFATGPTEETSAEAIAAWNTRSAQPIGEETVREALERGLEWAIDAANERKQKDAVFDNAMKDIRFIENAITALKGASHGEG